jgi:hypothetical protein
MVSLVHIGDAWPANGANSAPACSLTTHLGGSRSFQHGADAEFMSPCILSLHGVGANRTGHPDLLIRPGNCVRLWES